MDKGVVGIYMLTNSITGERYIGASKDIRKRIWGHKKDAKANRKLKISKAIAKYGFDNFKVEVLEVCSVDELDEKEVAWIANLKPEYNTALGGKAGLKGYKHSDEVRRHLSELGKKQWERMSDEQKNFVKRHNLIGPRIGHEVSQETREKLRRANLGKKQPPEVGAKISAGLKGKPRANKHHWKPVRCVNTGEVFESIKLAAEGMGLNTSGIVSVLRGRQAYTGNHYVFEYVAVV